MRAFVAILLFIFCPLLWSATELRVNLPEVIKAGDLVRVKAEIIKIEGATNLASLNHQTLDDSLYIHQVGLIEKNSSSPNGSVDLDLIFLKSVERMPLVSKNGDILIYLSTLKVEQTPETKEFILFDWKLPWNFPWWGYVILIVLFGLILWIASYYPHWRKKQELKKTRQQLWGHLINATTHEDIMKVWQSRLTYYSHFPDIEKKMRDWEKSIYPYIFKQNISDEEKLKIQKTYQKFVSELPLRRDYGV